MILVVCGTRPEIIKLYPFQKYKKKLGLEFLWVDQSPDLKQDLIKFDYELPECDLRDFIHKSKYKAVMVVGDTRTAFRGAVYGFESNKKVIHIEAGMRTWDLKQPFPEEGYRQMIDCIAKLKYCSTEEAETNCGGIFLGQTSIDTLFEFAGKIEDKGFWIVTVHRREAKIKEIIKRLKKEQKKRKLIIFAHPNRIGQELKKHFKTWEPLKYTKFVKMLAKCTGVITDSGGLVEEAVALRKQVIQLRKKSERGHGETYEKGATKRIVEDLCLRRL